MSNQIPPFSSQELEAACCVLRAACCVLADTSQGLTGTQIECLLKDINVQDIDPFNTKMEASVRNSWHEPYTYVKKNTEASADATGEYDYGVAATQMVSSLIIQGGLAGHLSLE